MDVVQTELHSNASSGNDLYPVGTDNKVPNKQTSDIALINQEPHGVFHTL